jgi:hypothetical protein
MQTFPLEIAAKLTSLSLLLAQAIISDFNIFGESKFQ